jgi:sec-independent protein translocase protein TatB
VLALILDSLGSTELLFILVIALMFFGPRKLPQLSRTIGKSLAEFRKASEDFKRTWEREVALESARSETGKNNTQLGDDDSILDQDGRRQVDEPSVSPIPAEHVMARRSSAGLPEFSGSETNLTDTNDGAKSESLPKREWL